jgi:hypothetical protein
MYSSFGKKIGVCITSISKLPNGGNRTVNDVTFMAGAHWAESEVYSAPGNPLLLSLIIGNHGLSEVITVRCSASGSTLIVEGQGKVKMRKTLPYPKDWTPRKEVLPGWKSGRRWAKGQRRTYLHFDYFKRVWKLTTWTYLGDVVYRYHGKDVKSHELESDANVIWLDDDNLPYEEDTPHVRRVRR